MRQRNALVLGVLAFGLVLTSCSKDPLANLTQEESRIYITNTDSTVNFASFNTYSLSDSVTVINNGQATRQQSLVDQAFITAVKTQLDNRGYTQVAASANPQLAVNVNRIYNTSTGLIRYRDYYNDYYGGYYDPFFYGYPGYNYYSPYGYATYTIREGALSVDILDLKNAASKNRIDVIWTGLIRGSGIFNASTAGQQVSLLFQQSPNVRTN